VVVLLPATTANWMEMLEEERRHSLEKEVCLHGNVERVKKKAQRRYETNEQWQNAGKEHKQV
jgi:hypothetical protein